jgi:eukaryotic-like serine/threonine-protein kinase
MKSVTPEQWQSISAYLDQALELEEPERAQWLAALAQNDPAVAELLSRVLAEREQEGFSQFLAGPTPIHLDDIQHATLIGRQVGPYVIEAEVGRGGMGSVWRARRADGRFEGTVAIKFVHAAWIGRIGEQRFLTEGKLLGQLNHPNIARLIDAGVLDATQPYLVIEYVEGEPIDAYCDRQRLGVEDRTRLFLSVLAAVAHAHSHLIVHRDIKPANIYVTRDGVVKLLDFGIAKLLDDGAGSAALTKSSATALTPQYAAPEQLLGQAVSTTTDVYSLGLVLFMLLTGTHPFAGDSRSIAELLRVVLTNPPPRASSVAKMATIRRASLEGDLDTILGKALKKDPAERYAAIGAFEDDLRRFLSHEPISARPDTVPYRLSKFVRRHRGGVVVGALVAIGLVSTSALALFQMANARHQRDVARSELRRAEAANDFSSLMLEEVGEGGRLLSREQLLDRGVQLLDARYGGDRAFVADMLTQLAGRYGDAERNDMAIDLTKRAISIARQAGDPPLLAMTLCEGAHQEVQGETHPDVDAWLTEANMLIAPLGEVPLRVSVTCLVARATRATNAGDWDQAIPMLMEAHALQVADGVQTGLFYTSVLNDLGGIYFNQGRFLEAYRMIAEIGAAFDRGGRGGTVGRSIIHENAASALVRMGEPHAALVELEGAHFLTGGRVSDGEVPLGARPLLALTLRRLGHLQEARDIIAGVADQMMAADNPTIASNALIQEGAILIELGHPDSARPLLERAVDIMSRNPNARAGALAQAQGLLADLETGIGRPEAAHRRLDAFLNSMGYSQDRSKLILEPALVSAARAMLALGALARGESYANDALEIAERTARARDSSADVGEVLMLLARLRIAEHRPQEAKPLLERAIQCFGNGLGTDAPLTDAARKMLRSIPAV